MLPLTRPHLAVEVLEDRSTPASAGSLDPTFGDGGRVVVPFSPDEREFATATSAALQSGGRVLIAGSVSNPPESGCTLARLTADGRLDPAFGDAGRVFLPKAGNLLLDRPEIAVLPDDRILIGATVQTGAGTAAESRDFGLTRFLSDGRIDPSFGGGGWVVIPFTMNGRATTDVLTGIAVDPAGRVLLTGTVSPGPGTVFGVARVTADGRPDPAFGTGGTQVVGFDPAGGDDDLTPSIAALPDGRVAVAGTATASDLLAARAAVAVLTAGGQLDPGFGAGGRQFAPFPYAGAVAAQPDGKIVVAGQGAAGQVAIARLNPDGNPDPSFGVGGVGLVPFAGLDGLTGAGAGAVAVQPDGRIVATGVGGRPFHGARDQPFDAVATRLLADGRSDPTFGRVVFPLVPSYPQSSPVGVLVQPGGGVVIAGTSSDGYVPTRRFAAVRLIGTGEPVPLAPILVGGPADGTGGLSGQDGSVDPAAFFSGADVPVRVATADVTGDGVPDLIGGAGLGGGPEVVVLDGKTRAKIADFFAFPSSFTGGIFVAAADINGDGKADVVATPDQGGGPVVAVYDGAGLTAGKNEAAQIARFFGIDDPAFRGGARPAVGDLSGDGAAELVVSAGFLGGPRVAIFDGRSVASGSPPVKLVPDFFAFEPGLRNGAFVAAGDVNGDGRADVAFGGGPGGAPRVRLIDGRGLVTAGPISNLDEVASAQVANFFAGDAASRGGARVALRDTDGDGKADLIAGSGEGEPAAVRVYTSTTLLGGANPSPDQTLDPFGGAALADGVFVG